MLPACWFRHLAETNLNLTPRVLFSFDPSSLSMKKNLHNGLKSIPESKMSAEARVASQAHRRATRKKRAELRRRGLPMIIWKDGKVREVPA
jgi:hypothetical protein